MNLMEKASLLNTTGVMQLVDHHNYDGAIDALTQSIRNMKQELISSSQSPPISAAHDAATAEIEFCDVGDSDEDIPCNRAILISYPDAKHDIGNNDIQLFSAAVIYNIALVHHHQVIHDRRNKNSGHAAEKAKKLYETVIKLLSGFTFFECSVLVRSAVLIQLACCNNLAQLHFRSGSDDRARRCLEMTSDFFSISERLNDNKGEDAMIQGLLLRAFLLRSRPQMAAAA